MRRKPLNIVITLTAVLLLLTVAVFAQPSVRPSFSLTHPASPPSCEAPGGDPFALPNMLHNPSFNLVGPNGIVTSHTGLMPFPFLPSAAAGWLMHNSNFGATILTRMEPSNGPQGPRLLHIRTGGAEGGVLQNFSSLHPGTGKIVGAAWVYVRRGNVQLVIHADGAPTASAVNTKVGEWELLTVCSDGNSANSMFLLLNQDPTGGDFYVDAAAVVKTH